MKIVGCDLHTRYQQIAMLDSETGELVERRLERRSTGVLRRAPGMKVRTSERPRLGGVGILRLRRPIRCAGRPAPLRMTRWRFCDLNEQSHFQGRMHGRHPRT
jgi:hypothetical protein